MRTVVRTVVLALVAALAIAVVPLSQPSAQAANAADFDPGYLISNARFYDAYSMSESEIQGFLTAQVPRCVAGNGLTCLRSAQFDTFDRAASGLCAAYNGANGEYAARVIARVASACGINPQVLIVMLQKEQGLITAVSPTERQYRSAMGYGCPDTAPCDAQYYGFYNQLYKAAWQLRQYGVNPTKWKHYPGTVSVLYHPNAACGSSAVNILNQPTASLYNYTPYQPNNAALANLGGVGDGCSSYGNRNFWVYFSNWFGSPTGPNGRPYIAAEYQAQGGAASLGTTTSTVLVIPDNGGGMAQAFQLGSIYWTAATGAKTVRSGPILNYYFARNGASGALGWPTSNVASVADNGGGTGQAFQAGSVYSSSAGTFLVSTKVRDAYFSLNGASGPLGWPAGEESCTAGDCIQRFQNGAVLRKSGFAAQAVVGSIYSAFSAAGGTAAWGWPASAQLAVGTGTAQVFTSGSAYAPAGGAAHLVSGAVRDYYFMFGGATGSLGFPVADQVCGRPDGGCAQAFQKGDIIWSPASGSRIGSLDIDAAYQAAGGASGAYGAAAGPVVAYAFNGGGAAQAYAGGSFYFKRGLGAFGVSGRMLTGYFAQSGAAGPLGWPAGSAKTGLVSAGTSQRFESGALYWTSATGAQPVTGAILTAYTAVGEQASDWGYPTMASAAITQNGGGTGQAFVGGSAYARSGSAAFLVSGTIRAAYFAQNGAAGPLGFPTGPSQCGLVNGGCAQEFQGGSIYWSPGTGAFTVSGTMRTAYWAAGGPGGSWGWPSSWVLSVTANGGGTAQVFTGGSAYAAGSGPAYLVSGVIRDRYFARSGAAGPLGFPTSSAVCVNGACSQQFTGGTLTSP